VDVGSPIALRKVLLATDLSARCDRALERAVAIAEVHQAELTIVHACEAPHASLAHAPAPSWRQPLDVASLERRRIREELRLQAGSLRDRTSIVIEEGDAADLVERIATSERADLIVAGIASEGTFPYRTPVVGKTVEQLLRRSHIPVLIVRNRARAMYEHIVVAVDLSPVSGFALQVALRFFPDRKLRLLHAFEPPYARHAADARAYEESHRAGAAADLDKFLESIYMSEQDRARLEPWIEVGTPQEIVREYVHLHEGDLVVLGTSGRGAVAEALLGSTAKSIISALPCDALVVRGPRG
jgi:nucleotide-binding universal stress UspA family protein